MFEIVEVCFRDNQVCSILLKRMKFKKLLTQKNDLKKIIIM